MHIMVKTVTSFKLTVTLIALNLVVGIASFSAYTNYQQAYAQSFVVGDDASNNDDANSKSSSFTKPVNLTNNTRDSVYAQIASNGKSVYMVWQENNDANYDIYLKKSTDEGLTFGKEINLSNNPGFSEHPQIAISGNNVYVTWIDDTPLSPTTVTGTKVKELLFRSSIDGGSTFDKIINLSNSSNSRIADSSNQEITAAGNNVYVVWQGITLLTTDYDTSKNADNNTDRSEITGNKKNSSILFLSSTDGGNTFNGIKSLTSSSFKSYPKIAAFENSTYVIWNTGIIGDTNRDDNNSKSITRGIFFTKSLDRGNSFTDAIKLNSDLNSIGESQVAATGNGVYVVWGGNPDEKIPGNLFFVKSSDNGNRFSEAVSLTEKNSLNVEVIADESNNVYIAWQALLSDGNQEILFKKSSDNGGTFTDTNENISKNQGISECTSIDVSENNKVYIAWEDDTYGNHEILFTKST